MFLDLIGSLGGSLSLSSKMIRRWMHGLQWDLAFLICISLWLCFPQVVKAEAYPPFRYELVGGRVNQANAHPTFGVLLVGGDEAGAQGEEGATRWFLERGDTGDYLVIRYNKLGSQADYIWDNYSTLVSSAAELAINTRHAANDPAVAEIVRNAELIFLAGGDQNEYEDLWKNTLVAEVIATKLAERQVVIGGTSAGMAILGGNYYAPACQGLLSSEILDDPFHPNTRNLNSGDFLQVPFLEEVITDTHLDRLVPRQYPEKRYGRIFGFLARIVDDNGGHLPAYGIGLEEGALVTIDERGIATSYGNGQRRGEDAYFLKTNGFLPERIEAGRSLIWDGDGKAVAAYHLAGTPEGQGEFDLTDWSTARGGCWEYWYTTGGEDGFVRH